jgi:hypothetical protein
MEMYSAKLLRNVWHAHSLPSVGRAFGLAIVCACAAFSYFWVNQSIRYRRSTADTPSATVLAEASQQQPTATKAKMGKNAPTVAVVVPKGRNAHETEFTLAESNELQRMGPISIRLRAVHPANSSYDVTLRINQGHEWNKVNVKVNEPIPLLRGRHSNQLVVYAIFQNHVSGYIERVQPRS